VRAICMSVVALALGAPAMPADRPPTQGPAPARVIQGLGLQAMESTPPSSARRAEKEQARPPRLAGASKTTLGKAIEIALLKVPGEALRAEIEREGGKTLIAVTVLARGQLFVVEIDGETGTVLDVEEDDEDGDDDDDDNGAAAKARLSRQRLRELKQ